MQLKLFVVYDKINERVNFPITAGSVEQAIRENTPMLYQLNRDFEKEYALYEVGMFDTNLENSLEVFPLRPPVRHSWNSYEHFYSIVEQMSAREKNMLKSQPIGVTEVPIDKK